MSFSISPLSAVLTIGIERALRDARAVLGGGTPPRSLAKLRAELKRLREESRAAAAEHERSLAEVSRLEAQIERIAAAEQRASSGTPSLGRA